MSNASQQIVNKAWNFAHVLALPLFSRPPINALDQLRGVATEFKAWNLLGLRFSGSGHSNFRFDVT